MSVLFRVTSNLLKEARRGGSGRGAPSQFSEEIAPFSAFSLFPIVKLGNGRHDVKTL